MSLRKKIIQLVNTIWPAPQDSVSFKKGDTLFYIAGSKDEQVSLTGRYYVDGYGKTRWEITLPDGTITFGREDWLVDIKYNG
jgi:hypothetical protein